MQLSSLAKNLLNENKIEELQALPLSYLIVTSQYDKIINSIKNPKAALLEDGEFYSVPRELRDHINLDSLEYPVVISSGQIYSRSSVVDILSVADREVVVCPETREPIRRDCFGPEDEKQSFVRLPQIDAAVANFKQALKIDRAIDALSFCPTTLKLNFRVSRNILRVEIEPEAGSNPEILRAFLQECFPDARSEIIITEAQQRAGMGYIVYGFGRCWRAKESHAIIDFWYPQDTILDEDVNFAMTALLKPLNLPESFIPPGSVFGSLSTLGLAEYKDAFPGINLRTGDVAKCCKSFIEFSKNFAASRDVLNDVVTVSEGAYPSNYTGMMLFGRPQSSGMSFADRSYAGMSSSTSFSSYR